LFRGLGKRLRTRIKEILTFIVGHKKYIFFTIILNLIFIKPYFPKSNLPFCLEIRQFWTVSAGIVTGHEGLSMGFNRDKK
jgi:hypothetical protein